MADWARAIDEIGRLRRFIEVSAQGLHEASHASEWVDLRRRVASALKQPNPFKSEAEYSAAKDEAARLEKFARLEADAGFPYLHALAIGRLWSILETMSREVALHIIVDKSDRPLPQALHKIHAPIIEFTRASPEEQAEFLVSEIHAMVRADFRPGIDRFEAVLRVLDLGGPVPDDVRRLFMELVNIRDVIVHCSGRADKRFVSNCPWLNYTVGQEVRISRSDFWLYTRAAHWYVLEIDARLSSVPSGSVVSDEAKLQQQVLNEIGEAMRLREANERTGTADVEPSA
jgi:hypothetical protein